MATLARLCLNGTSQYVKVADANSLDITGDITIAAWVKPGVVTTQDVVKKAVTTGTTVNGYELDLATNTGTTCTPGTNPCAFGRFNQRGFVGHLPNQFPVHVYGDGPLDTLCRYLHQCG